MTGSGTGEGAAGAGRGRGVALLVLLGLAGCLAYADRVAFSVAADPVGRALGLGDSGLGALGGLGFSLFYAAAALPLGRIGDRGHRVAVIAWSVVAWSLATLATGRAHGFATLFAARLGVGIGEAGLVPNAVPMIARLFRSPRHAPAFAAYWTLAYGGLVLGPWAGGVLVDRFGWRTMFLLAALPGPPLALAIALVGRGVAAGPEPDVAAGAARGRDGAAGTPADPGMARGIGAERRRDRDAAAGAGEAPARTGGTAMRGVDPDAGQDGGADVAAGPVAGPGPVPEGSGLARDLAALARVPGFGHVLAFGASSGLVAWAGVMWDAPFYMRRFGLDAGEAGFWFGLAFGLATVLGTAASGPLGARIGPGGNALRIATLVFLAGQPFQLAAYLAPDLPLSLAAMAITTVTGAAIVGPLWSSMQAVLPPRLRATGTVAYGFAASVVGAGLGPPLFGAVSDALRPRLGAGSLQASLAIAAVLGFWPALHLLALARAGAPGRAVSRPRRCAPRSPRGARRRSSW